MSIIVTKSNGTSDVTYTFQQTQGANIQVFGNASAGLVEPETLRIQHLLRPPGQKGTDRHNIVFSKAVVEDTTNNYLVASASLQLSVPRSSEITLTIMKDLISQLISYVGYGPNMTALFNGSSPEGDYNVTGPFNPTIAG
jgi:hypothetical protein